MAQDAALNPRYSRSCIDIVYIPEVKHVGNGVADITDGHTSPCHSPLSLTIATHLSLQLHCSCESHLNHSCFHSEQYDFHQVICCFECNKVLQNVFFSSLTE